MADMATSQYLDERGMYMQKNRLLRMTSQDLCVLYSSLELFRGTYTDLEEEAGELLGCVKDIYMRQYGEDIDEGLKGLINPRSAGRKGRYLQEDREQVASLHRQGCTIREIAQKTGIPPSSVQRMLSSTLYHN